MRLPPQHPRTLAVYAQWAHALAQLPEAAAQAYLAAGKPYFKRCASDSERERHCARVLRKFRENTVAPYGSRL